MEKKRYISPVLKVVVLTHITNILSLSGGETLGYGGNTNDNNINSSDTKSDGGWGNIWDE